MKTQISDASALQAVRITDIAAYLASRGWDEVGCIGEKASLWRLDTGVPRAVELLLPVTPEFIDYAERISDALRAIELVEGRSQTEILVDITTSGADVLRIPLRQRCHGDGTIRLEDGLKGFERAAYTTAATLDVIAMLVGLLPGAIQQILHGLAEGLEGWARRRAIRRRGGVA
jgi:hypothetical protein